MNVDEPTRPHLPLEDARCQRIREAAWTLLMERGYAGASTTEIARAARVSKRDLYACFESKGAIVAACVTERTRRMRQHLVLPSVRDRETLAATLIRFAMTVLKTVSHPTVTALYRLAIGEATTSPELARSLEESGRAANHAALTDFLLQAQKARLIAAEDPAGMAAFFFSLLWGDLQLRLALGTAEPPDAEEIERRAQRATHALLALHPAPKTRARQPFRRHSRHNATA